MQPLSVTAYIPGIGHPCYGQLTLVKTRHPLTSITWPYRGLNFRAHLRRVFYLIGCMFSTGSQAKAKVAFHKFISGAPLLGLVKSIYWGYLHAARILHVTLSSLGKIWNCLKLAVSPYKIDHLADYQNQCSKLILLNSNSLVTSSYITTGFTLVN